MTSFLIDLFVMTPRQLATLKFAVIAGAVLMLVLLFPRAVAFVEMGARELRYLWWVVLLIALAIWLIFGLGKKSK